MYFDAFTISALVDEFMDTLVGGRIQDVLDVDPTGLGLEIYAHRQRRYLYLSADPMMPRVHLVGDKLRRGLQRPTQLGLLFRRYIEGGILEHVSQPPWERILQLDVSGPKGDVAVIIEPMERRSNILLVQDGVILDCMRRVGPEDNRYRLSLPNHEYVPPPPMTGKRDPFTIQREDVVGFFEQNDNPKQQSARILSSHLLGMSPLLAREVLFRASGNARQKAHDTDPDGILDSLQAVLAPLKNREWQPGVAGEHGAEAFSVYPLEHVPDWEPVDTISEALSIYYGAPVGEDAYNQAKKPVQAAIDEGKAKMSAKLASLKRSLKDDAEREQLRQSGELLLAYQYSLEAGQTELRAQYDPSEPELVITLNPDLTPLENAQRYFERYEKAKRALDDVPKLIKETQTELRYLDQLESDLELAANWPDIDEVQQALLSRGYMTQKSKRIGGGGRSGPMKLTKDGYIIWVGRNSRQNELVTFKNANSQDLWLHARDVPGAHVIIRNDGRRISQALIEQAAAIAAYYSSKRGESSVIVDVTRRKYVKKIKGAGPGMVTYRNEKTVTVQPQNESILEKD